MKLIKRFSAATCNHAISISELQNNKTYHIMNAVRYTTKFGQSIVVAGKDDTNKTVRMFLPKRYIHVFTDDGINSIKERKNLQIVNQGKCE